MFPKADLVFAYEEDNLSLLGQSFNSKFMSILYTSTKVMNGEYIKTLPLCNNIPKKSFLNYEGNTSDSVLKEEFRFPFRACL